MLVKLYHPLKKITWYGIMPSLCQNSSGVERLTRNEQVKGSIPFFGSGGFFKPLFSFMILSSLEKRIPGRSREACYFCLITAWAAAKRAMGTRKGEQET